MKKTTIAGLVGLLFSPVIYALDTPMTSDEVIVTATRFSENDSSSAPNLKIISKDDIKNSPAISIPDVLRMQAGLNITSLYGSQGIDATVDSRGFGDSAISNTLVLLDGQRLNTLDSSNIQWASIPLQAIDHIEIIPGSGSVLYGDRASGGVINLITDKSGKSAASVTASVGSYGYESLDGFISGGKDDFYFNTFVHTADSNGWRQNSASNQWSVSGRAGLCFENGDAFIDYSIYRVANGLPGSISSAVYQINPRAASTPLDSQTKDGVRVRPGVSIKLTDHIEFATELSLSQEDQHFDNPSLSSLSDRDLNTYSFTPRIKWAHGLGNLKSTSIVGVDYYHGKIDADNIGFANQNAKQISKAVYIQNNTALTSSFDFSAGLRSQQMDQSATQDAYAPFGSPAASGKAKPTKTVYDLGLSYHETGWGVYSKLGSSFRFANTDELFNYDPFTGFPIFSGTLIKPQSTYNKEIGLTFNQNDWDGRVALYHTNVKDEIGYDGNLGINTNYDPTRHEGIETELGWQMLSNLKSKLSYAYTNAEFTSGIYQDKRIPSVANNTAHAQLLWDHHQYGKYVAQINYVGERYTSGDFANTLNKLPSYTTLDLRASWDLKPVTLSLTALNILDKKYSPFALFSMFRNDYFYYPADGRTVYLSARYDF